MKSCFDMINIFLLYILIFLGNANYLLDFNYPSAISLLNDNVFVVEKDGIFVYDEQLKNIIYSHPFKYENDKIDSDVKLSKVIVRFKANYIICLINGKIFFFDHKGKELLLETDPIITETNYDYPELIPITELNDQDNYYYVITYLISTSDSYQQKLIFCKINTNTKFNTPIKSLIADKLEDIKVGFDKTYHFLNKGLSCEYVRSDNVKESYEYLACFFIIDKDELTLSNNYFEISTNDINIFTDIRPAYEKVINDVVQIQSVTKADKKISFVCLLFLNGNLECYQFHFEREYLDTRDFYNPTGTIFKCKNSKYGLRLNYFDDGETLSLSCINNNNNIQVKLFNQYFQAKNPINEYTQFTQCGSVESINSHSIIQHDSNYYIISDMKCDNLKRCFEPLNGDLSPNEIVDCNGLEKCEICGQESSDKNLCLKCNQANYYYYLNYYPQKEREKYIECINVAQKPPTFYFNEKNEDYEPCYSTCATCEYGGGTQENNCTSCDGVNYIKNPDDDTSSNCVIKCKYFYYIEQNIYTCTTTNSCPDDHNFIIKEKSKCINNCQNDNEYKYSYNGECFKECPNNTNDDNDFICKDIDINKCYLTESDEYISINENITFNEVEKLVTKYSYEFNYTDSHVTLYKDGDYTITIYIDNKCIFELELGIPEIDFGYCYEKVKNQNSINNRELIIAIIDKIESPNNRKVIKYGMFNPLTGEHLDSDTICEEDKITFTESIEDKLLDAKMDLQALQELMNEGIDVFNLSSPFYNDVCFEYNSKKDIALKDRILEYFPNITLCEEGCDLIGINMTTITTICECFYSETKKEDALKNKVLEQAPVGGIGEIISSSNIYVMKCIDLVLNIDKIKKAYGVYIIVGFIFIEIICTIVYCAKDISLIHKYLYEISNKYVNYLDKKKANNKNVLINNQDKLFLDINNINSRLPKIYVKNKTIDNKIVEAKLLIRQVALAKKDTIQQNTNNSEIKNGKEINIINKNVKINNNKIFGLNKDKKIFYNNNIYNKDELSNSSNINFQLNGNKDLFKKSNNDDVENTIEKYLETGYEEMDYDDAIRKDKRKFCECYKEKIMDNQIIVNLLCSYEPIRPKSIKIIFLILQIDLYFFINGLFYNEEYISNIYHLEKDTIFTMAERFFENLIYAALAGIITNYIIEFFFIEESKIKKIFKLNKDNILDFKIQINKIFKSIKRRYVFFIIISFIISLITLVHISCFNIVYNHTMVEWLIFSLIIIVSIQIGTFLICLVQTALRCIGLRCKSEKLYKLSL